MLHEQGAYCCWLLSPPCGMFLPRILLARVAPATDVFYYEPCMLVRSHVNAFGPGRLWSSRGCKSCVKAHGACCMCCTICGPPCLRCTLYSCAQCIHLYVVLGHRPRFHLALNLQAAFQAAVVQLLLLPHGSLLLTALLCLPCPHFACLRQRGLCWRACACVGGFLCVCVGVAQGLGNVWGVRVCIEQCGY